MRSAGRLLLGCSILCGSAWALLAAHSPTSMSTRRRHPAAGRRALRSPRLCPLYTHTRTFSSGSCCVCVLVECAEVAQATLWTSC